jgi:hypothetical protein
LDTALALPALYSIDSYGRPRQWFPVPAGKAGPKRAAGRKSMGKFLLILGFIALAIGLLWIGQGLGVIAWPASSFMINQIQWAGYGAALCAVGLILIWQSRR